MVSFFVAALMCGIGRYSICHNFTAAKNYFKGLKSVLLSNPI
jgi:hypothetical protein